MHGMDVFKVHDNNQLYKSLAGDQLWNSGRRTKFLVALATRKAQFRTL